MKYNNSSDHACRIPDDSDYSAKVVRAASQAPTITTFVLYVLIIWLRITGRHPHLVDILMRMVKNLVGFAIIYAILQVATGWYFASTTSWLHLRFLLDSASLTVDSVVFVAIAVPGYFLESPLAIPGLIAHFCLMIPFFIHWAHKTKEAMDSQPDCYDGQILTDVWIFSGVDFFVFVTTCVLTVTFNHAPRRQNNNNNNPPGPLSKRAMWWTIGAMAPFTIMTGVQIVFSWANYGGLRSLLLNPTPTFIFGQVLNLERVLVTIVAVLLYPLDINARVRVQYGRVVEWVINKVVAVLLYVRK